MFHNDVFAEWTVDGIWTRMEEEYKKGSMWLSIEGKVATWAKVVVVGMGYNNKLYTF